MAELKKVLSMPVMLIITINSIMGTGIFFLPAIGARIAGPASMISWGILAILSIYIAMCFGELTSMFPTAGGVYEFSKQAYGGFFSFIIGWITFLAGNITIAMLIVGAIQYLLPLQIIWPKILISLMFILIFNIIAYKGMKLSSVMLVTFGIITMSTLILLIIPNLIKLNMNNYQPFFVTPIPIIFFAIFFIAETFFGWETATFLAGETKDGEKTMPKVLILGTIIIAIISLTFVFSSLGFVSWKVFGNFEAPLAYLGTAHYGSLGGDVFTILVYMSIIGSVAGWIVSAPRLILSMAEDKLLPQQLASIHPKYFTPHKAIIFQIIITSILVVVGAASYAVLLEMLLPFLIFMYSVVLIALVVLRFKKPEIKRYYKVPFGKTGPFLVIAFMLFLMYMWIENSTNAVQILKIGASFILFGVPLYFLLLFYYDPDAIIKINNYIAYLKLWFEKILYPIGLRTKLFNLVGEYREKIILEYGSNVGTLTMELAERVGPNGKIYATEMIENNLKILKKRIDKKGHKHVELIYDPHQVNRIHPKIDYADMVFSSEMLSYIQDLEKVLKEIHKILPENGRICFVDYIDFFKIMPNGGHLSDLKKLKKKFLDAGFSINVEKHKGLFWNYIIVYGIKTSKKDIVFV
ncbi:amino acid permease [Candidatus Woesearchaeota archaeon]|nr:amino acid permease [Candidatus Woesearchaeota archaeon]